LKQINTFQSKLLFFYLEANDETLKLDAFFGISQLPELKAPQVLEILLILLMNKGYVPYLNKSAQKMLLKTIFEYHG